MTRWTLALAAALLVTAGCAKKDEAGPGEPPAPKPDRAIAKAEAVRGHTACQTWADRACACAETQPEVAEVCAEAKKMPEALRIAISTANAKSMEDDVRARLQLEARRIVARCIEQTVKLPCAATPK